MKYDVNILRNYVLYLQVITNKINSFFEEQKDYIMCHQGCAKCCKGAQFPFTEIEFRFLLEGFVQLDEELKMKILRQIDDVLAQKCEYNKNHNDKKFRYDCPFLVNDNCAVYNYRGLICRSFGLMTFINGSKEKSKMPFCAFEGLNYSNVLDPETSTVSTEKFKALNIETVPKAFNIDYYTTLTNNSMGESFGFEFGEEKPLINWLEESINSPK